jgi:hypothetical protein
LRPIGDHDLVSVLGLRPPLIPSGVSMRPGHYVAAHPPRDVPLRHVLRRAARRSSAPWRDPRARIAVEHGGPRRPAPRRPRGSRLCRRRRRRGAFLRAWRRVGRGFGAAPRPCALARHRRAVNPNLQAQTRTGPGSTYRHHPTSPQPPQPQPPQEPRRTRRPGSVPGPRSRGQFAISFDGVLHNAGIDVVKIPPECPRGLLRRTHRVDRPRRAHQPEADLRRNDTCATVSTTYPPRPDSPGPRASSHATPFPLQTR